MVGFCGFASGSDGRSDRKYAHEGGGFAYEDRQILHDINFEAKPDQIVAIVGPSGSCKTTLLNLFLRFFDACTGRITIDGLASLNDSAECGYDSGGATARLTFIGGPVALD